MLSDNLGIRFIKFGILQEQKALKHLCKFVLVFLCIDFQGFKAGINLNMVSRLSLRKQRRLMYF